MTKRAIAVAMLVIGALCLIPLGNVVFELVQAGPLRSENLLFVLLCAVPALGSGLLIGGLWLWASARKSA